MAERYQSVYGEEKVSEEKDLIKKLEETRESPLVLNNQKNMELVRARLQQLLERVDAKESPDRLRRLTNLWEKFTEATKAGRRVEATQVMASLDVEFGKAREDFSIWNQMFEAIDLDRKLVESETKVLKEMKAIMTAEDAHELAVKLLSAIVNSIQGCDIPSDKKAELINNISHEFTVLVGQ